MFLFVVYALVVWYASLRWRRRAAGFVVIVASLFGMHLFNMVHGDIAARFGYDENIFRGLMYPYMVLVAGVGFYLFSFPRELPRGRVHCRACWFDLSDHEDLTPETPCPECGMTAIEAKTWKGRRAARRRLAATGPAEEIQGLVLNAERSPADDANSDAHKQHAHG
ncbi:MAG: hypothetical protein AAFR76_11045 [Planctomycetota bacterium]